MENQRYKSANAFRRTLEDRLKRMKEEQKTDLARLRKRVAFDRLLARLFDSATSLRHNVGEILFRSTLDESQRPEFQAAGEWQRETQSLDFRFGKIFL